MVQPFSRDDEEDLLDALKDVTGTVESEGLSPDDAIVKVAKERQTPLTMLPLLVQAYNVGQCVHNRESSEGVLAKTASVPLANLHLILPRLLDQPVVKESCDLSEYAAPPKWAAVRTPSTHLCKAAESLCNTLKAPPLVDAEGEKDQKKRQKRVKAEKARQELEAARGEVEAVKTAFLQSLFALREYFQKSAMDRRSFAEVAFNAKHLFGVPAVSLLDYVYTANNLVEPKTAPLQKVAAYATKDMLPYSLVKSCCDLAATLLDKQRIYAEKLPLQHKEAKYDPFAEPKIRCGSVITGFKFKQAEKAASLPLKVLDEYTQATARDMLPFKPVSELRKDPDLTLSSPAQQTRLRKIKAETMLTDFLTNDEVLSGQDPEAVAAAFNELSLLAPRASLQPSIMRPLLRKYVTGGGLEPFELRELSALDRDIQRSLFGPSLAQVLAD